MSGSLRLVGTLLLLLATGAVRAAGDPAAECSARKFELSAAYTKCLFAAEMRAARQGRTPSFAKCDARLDEKFARIERKFPACPALGDAAIVRAPP